MATECVDVVPTPHMLVVGSVLVHDDKGLCSTGFMMTRAGCMVTRAGFMVTRAGFMVTRAGFMVTRAGLMAVSYTHLTLPTTKQV